MKASAGPSGITGGVAIACMSFSVVAGAAAGGFLAGRAVAQRQESERSVVVEFDVAPLQAAARRRIYAGFAAIPLPSARSEQRLAWQGAQELLVNRMEAAGWGIDLQHPEAALAKLKSVGAPEELAALLDFWSELADRSDHPELRDRATALATVLDRDPLRAQVRDVLLAADRTKMRELMADADLARLPARTSALLGALLLHLGERDNAAELWRLASIEHPDDVVLHLVLGWWLRDGEPPERSEAHRHYEAASALLPEVPEIAAASESTAH